MKAKLLLLLTAALLLASCSKNTEFPIPDGVQTVRAVLKPVPFSLKRRGTHALIGADGKMAAYAESTVVNLHALEGRAVELQGIFEKNTDLSALPVLVVQKVLSSGDEELRPWAIPALGMSLALPRSWKGSIKGSSALFTASGFTAPVLSISIVPSPNPSPLALRSPPKADEGGSPLYGPLPVPASDSSPEFLVVANRKAIAALKTDSWTVRILPSATEGKQHVLVFAIRSDLPADGQLQTYRKILTLIQFTSGGASSRAASSVLSKRSSAAATGSTGSSRADGDGAPCGGAAGILCPSGLYCRITDPVGESGVCSKK